MNKSEVPTMRRLTGAIAKIAVYFGMVAAGSGGLWYYERVHSRERQLEEQKKQLELVVQRFSADRRVAEILVRDQRKVDGVLSTTLLFVEYAQDGSTLPPRTFTIDGNGAHVEAMVIKFDRDFVAQNDPLRGHSIALFLRIFGDHQTPANGYAIDEPGKIPDIYKGSSNSEQQRQFEADLWKNFWRLADDKEYRQSKGVRVADGEGVWGTFVPDRLYTLTLDANGGLNLTSEPLKGIYREALKPK